MFDVSPKDITDGSLTRVLLALAAPLIVQNVALIGQQMVDIFWVGRIGENAVAAIGLVVPVIGILQVPALVTANGGQILTAQHVGTDDLVGARRVSFNAAILAMGLGAVLAVATWLLAPEVVALFGPGPEVAALAATYLGGYALALVTIGASDSLELGFTGWGDTRAALWINLSAIVVNLTLDPFLIFGYGPFPAWGIFGAAMATAVGYVFGALLALAFMYRGRSGFRLTRESFRVRPAIMARILAVGGPLGVEGLGRHLARSLVIGVVTLVGGAPGLAAYVLGARISTVAYIPARGLGQASTSVVGQNIGADQPGRATRVTWLGAAIAAVGLSVLGVVQWFYPAAIARIFIPGISGEYLRLTVDYLRILVYGYWALGAIYTLRAGFDGASRTRISMSSTLLQYWTIRVPVTVAGALVIGMGVHAAFWAVTVSNWLAAAGLGTFFYYTTSNGMLERAAEAAAAD